MAEVATEGKKKGVPTEDKFEKIVSLCKRRMWPCAGTPPGARLACSRWSALDLKVAPDSNSNESA